MVIKDVELRTGQPVRDVEISKSQKDEIRWISRDEHPYEVRFQGRGPFEESTFNIGKGTFKDSGRVRDDVTPPEDPAQAQQFKYSVHHGVSGWMLDPRVGVKK